jgi:hypothetical protein
MASKRRGRPKLAAAGGWGVISIVGAAFYFIGYGLTAVLVAIGSGLVAGILAALDLKENGADWKRPTVVATTKKEPKSAPNLTKGQAKTLVGTWAYRTKEAVANGQVRTVNGMKMSGKKCGHTCRNSRAPKKFCRCPCGGVQHGSERVIIPTVRTLVQSTVIEPRKPKTRPEGKPEGKKAKKPTKDKPKKYNPAIPAGPVEQQLVVIWKAPDGKYRRVQTSKATAQIMKRDGNLLKVEGRAEEVAAKGSA